MSNTYPVEKLNNVEWKDINWRKVERYVLKLQQRIFQASSNGRTHEKGQVIEEPDEAKVSSPVL
jgi:hypothetical protein